LPEKDGQLKSGFITRGRQTDKILSCFINLKNSSKTGVKLFLVFCESSFSLKRLCQLAANKASAGITRRIVYLRTFADRSVTILKQKELTAAAPVNPSILRIGSHQGQSWYDFAIKSGLADSRPAKLPYLQTSCRFDVSEMMFGRMLPAINLLLLLTGFSGLLLARQYLAGAVPASTVQTRFRLAILFATLMPFTAFFFVSYSFSMHFNNAMLKSRQQNLVDTLDLAETAIKNCESESRKKIGHFVQMLRGRKNLAPDLLQKVLDRHYGKTYASYAFLRNDGLCLERLPAESLASTSDYEKFLLVRDLVLAQIYNILEFSGSITDRYRENFAAIPGFRRWKAFSVHFNAIDKNSFCRQDGQFFPARQSDSSHFRISTHNLFPENASDSYWAGLMLVSNSKQAVEEFLAAQAENASFFMRRNSDHLVHLAVLACHDDSMSEIDKSIAWPQSALADQETLEAAQRVNSRKRQENWVETDRHGMTRLFAVKAVAELPFIIVASTGLSANATRTRQLWIFYLLMLLYSALLVYLVGSVLAEQFIKPIELLMYGTGAVNNNSYPVISFISDTELGKLVGEFGSMIEGMRQRQLLERFVAGDVSRTISEESIALSEESVRQVYRVIMFIHIRDFARICENQSPDESGSAKIEFNMKLLNIYFSHLEPVIAMHGGHVDKYIGDAMMISFAPENTGYCPEKAASIAALDCRKKLAAVNQVLLQNGIQPVVIGIGIAAGEVIRGRIGAKKGRQDFTLIGDAVNLAARLESISHSQAHSKILVSEAIAINSIESCRFIGAGSTRIKGKKNEIPVFSLEAADNAG
jgi:class 3 adenylate cyclase